MAWGWGMLCPFLASMFHMANLGINIDESERAHGDVYGDEKHEGKFSHEVLGGAG